MGHGVWQYRAVQPACLPARAAPITHRVHEREDDHDLREQEERQQAHDAHGDFAVVLALQAERVGGALARGVHPRQQRAVPVRHEPHAAPRRAAPAAGAQQPLERVAEVAHRRILGLDVGGALGRRRAQRRPGKGLALAGGRLQHKLGLLRKRRGLGGLHGARSRRPTGAQQKVTSDRL